MQTYLGEDIEKILGQEFLTWLWFKSETENSFTAGDISFDLFTERKIVVEYGDGQSVELASSSGPSSELKEARLGMAHGKKVIRATYRIEYNDSIYMVTLKATDFSLSGFRTPKLDTSDVTEEDEDAFFLEKMFLLEQGLQCIDALYSQYIHLRCSDEWSKECGVIRTWVSHSL